MATNKNTGAQHIDNADDIGNEKATVRQTSIYDEEILKEKAALGDYSGAKEKTDPKEIALVRKLDRWIMPM